MTIKPVAKSGDGKKDSHGHVQLGGEPPNQNVRSMHRNVIDNHAAQSPQRRGDVYEEMSRHRSHKRSKHHKRERERERYASTLQRCISPHMQPQLERELPRTSTLCQAQSSVDVSTATLIKAVEEAYSGYNSGDEHLRNKEDFISADEWRMRDAQFEKMMSEQGFILQNIEEDGACLFRAISLQIYGDEEMHDQIRQQTMDYLYKNREYYSQFLTEDVNNYIKRKRKRDAHGNHIEIQLMSELYNRPIELYSYKQMPINIFNSEQQNNGYPPLRLAYQRGSHYNAIIDPFNASVGVGLGLAGYKPELQTKDAMLLSEQLEIEQTMFEDKLKTTDWEATNEAIEEQIARESYLQWCRDNLQQKASQAEAETTLSANVSGSSTASAPAATSSTATVTSADAASPSKYHLHELRTSTCTVTNEKPNSSTTSPATTEIESTPPVPAVSADTSTATTTPALNSGNLSPKSLTAFAQSLRKDSELCFDSDDTDMSSTSSIDHSSSCGSVDKSANRGKKSKNRGATSRLSKRRRREVSAAADTAAEEEKENAEIESLTTPQPEKASAENDCDSETEKQPSRSPTPIKCDLFCDGDNDEVEESCRDDKSKEPTPSSSPKSPAQTSPASSSSLSIAASKQVVENDFFAGSPPAAASSQIPAALVKPTPEEPVSSFYQSLLEASYIADGRSADGFGQLSESEMLQQAIQLSTQEYLEDQKRKGGFLF